MNDLMLCGSSLLPKITCDQEPEKEGIQMNGQMMGGIISGGHYCIYEISPVEGKVDDLQAVKEMRRRVAEDVEKMDQIIKMLEDGGSY